MHTRFRDHLPIDGLRATSPALRRCLGSPCCGDVFATATRQGYLPHCSGHAALPWPLTFGATGLRREPCLRKPTANKRGHSQPCSTAFGRMDTLEAAVWRSLARGFFLPAHLRHCSSMPLPRACCASSVQRRSLLLASSSPAPTTSSTNASAPSAPATRSSLFTPARPHKAPATLNTRLCRPSARTGGETASSTHCCW